MSILVRHVMTEEPKTLKSDMSAADAAGMMASYDVGIIPVVDPNGSVSVVTDRDIVLRVIAARKDPSQVPLSDIATNQLVSVTPDTGIADARQLMAEHKVRRLPVMKQGELVGIVSLGDLAVADPSKRAIGDTLQRVSESQSTIEKNVGPDRGTPDRVRR
jgi:CBS domain-containing protein